MRRERKDRKSTQSIRPSSTNVKDTGRVRLGGISPSVGPIRSPAGPVIDTGKVRLGGIAPSV